MVAFVVILIILAGAVGFVAVSALKSENSAKYRNILSDLGIAGAWPDEGGSQFYKWGWHEDQNNRVSGERIVKQAFLKAGVWMDREDLAFFENQCKRHETMKDVDVPHIQEHVLAIIRKSDRIRQWVADQVLMVVQSVQSMTVQAAKEVLLQSQIEVEPEQAYERLVSLEMQRLLYRYGSQILALNAPGLLVQHSGSNQTFLLEKMDSWRHLVHMFKEEIQDTAIGRRIAIPAAISRGLRLSVESGFLRAIEVDVERHHAFEKKINDQFHNKEIQVSLERARMVDGILYKWKFDEGTHFSQEDQDGIRDVLSRADLVSRFRELLFERFDESFSSLYKLIHLFPRDVIFYGGHGAARSFAADQYSRHYLALLEAFAAPAGRPIQPPSIIWINDEQIEKMRQGPKKGTNAITLDQLISDQQRIIRFEQGITEETANSRGWILNLSMDYPTEQEFAILNKDPFKRYVRFLCEAAADVDFINNTYNAKKSRIQFFNLIIDSLVEVPSLKESSDVPAATDPGNASAPQSKTAEGSGNGDFETPALPRSNSNRITQRRS